MANVSPAPRWVGPGILLVLATAVISGVSTFVNTYAVQGTSTDAFVTVRNLAVAAAIAPVALLGIRSARSRLRPADWARLVVIGLIGGAIPFLLFFHGLALAARSGAATASFGYRTLFLMATVGAVVYLRERLSLRVLIAAALLLVGNFLLLSLTAPVLTDGTLFVLAATALWAAEYTLSKRALADLRSTTVALGRMGFGAVFLVAYLVLTAQAASVATFSASEWTWVGISAALLAGFVLSWYSGLKRTELSVASAVLVLGFPITWALGVAFRGAPVTLPAAAGAASVALGVTLAIGVAGWQATRRFLAGSGVADPAAA